MTRLLLPLVSRPGVALRGWTTAPCGCWFVIRATSDDLIWQPCPAHTFAQEFCKSAREAQAHVQAMPEQIRAEALRAPLYAQLADVLKKVETEERRQRREEESASVS